MSSKNLEETSLIISADNLEKKSKLRSLFEKRKELTCVAFYPDTPDALSKMTHNFFRETKILISQAHVNLIVNKCNGDRGILKNELSKIECENLKDSMIKKGFKDAFIVPFYKNKRISVKEALDLQIKLH